MATSQKRPRTPSTDYGPSLSPPTLEEITLCYLSVDAALRKNTNNSHPLAVAEGSIATTEIRTTSSDHDSRRSGHVSPWVIIVYLILVVNAILMSAVIIILILLIKDANHYNKKRPALIAWLTIESLFRLCAVCFTAVKYPITHTTIHSLGIFLGKEYYSTLVNSFWPDSDPFKAFVNLPGIRIDLVWFKQGLCYALVNTIIGIWIWVTTWEAVTDVKDDYAKLLAIVGLVACITNNISCLIGTPLVIWASLRTPTSHDDDVVMSQIETRV
ncbi:10595_t:CDS:2 [Paraglomus occultum]|uniref:10595_t:CDS:1 n=1 Tax=Paraglomus occultum TaxID=144539 RepID=A0A9N9FB65_9GLOM|nr:10595_t:CDS:2 [Paraglomus occultum]